MRSDSSRYHVTNHRPSEADLAVLAEIRRQTAPFKGGLSAPLGRPAYDEMMEACPPAGDVSCQQGQVAGFPAVWCRVSDAPKDEAILYLHGGGYAVGSAWGYRNFVGQFAARTGLDALIVDYPLAPEHPFPAALECAKAVYRALAEGGYARIVIMGDSAGGGLTLSLLAAVAADRGAFGAQPVCAVAMSPWTDLTLAGASHRERAAEEFYLDHASVEKFASDYAVTHPRTDPAVSPLFGSLKGLPRIQIHVGTAEILLSDSEAYADKAQAAGTDVDLHVWEAMPHVFPHSFAALEGAEQAMTMMTGFIRDNVEG